MGSYVCDCAFGYRFDSAVILTGQRLSVSIDTVDDFSFHFSSDPKRQTDLE